MKRFFAMLLCAVLLLAQVPKGTAAEISAASAVVMDAASGRVLYERDPHQRRLIASTTKLMTALVVLESGHSLDEEVTIPEQWPGVEGSSIYLRPGERVSLETLLYGMLLHSGNDAATILAQVCGGSVEELAAQMNCRAEQLGMKDSHFTNPSGLNDEEHYSTAYDMALLARACLENETLAEVVSTKTISMGDRVFTNHNKLLWRYEGCVGLKTGYTEKAGRTLVSAAQRDGLTLICVTLNAPNDWADHTALLDESFARFQAQTVAAAGDTLCRLPVTGSLLPFCPVTVEEDVALCLEEDEEPERELRLGTACLQAPVTAGTPVGEVVFSVDGEELCRTRLVAAADLSADLAPRENPLEKLLRMLTDNR